MIRNKQHYLASTKILREIRKSRCTQVELGAKLGEDQAFISKIERGERRIDIVELIVILKALDYDPFTFIEGLTNEMEAS